MADLSIVKSEPLDTGGGLRLVKSEPLPQDKQGVLSAFWEGIGGKALMDIMGGASRDPKLIEKSIDTLKGLASGLTNEGPRIMKELDSAGEAIRKGDWGLAAHHAAGAAPLFGAAVQNAGAELERGDTRAAAGHTAALFAPFLAKKVPALVQAAADTDAGAAVIGGAKGAVGGALEPGALKLKVKGVPIEIGTGVPASVAGAITGGGAGAAIGSAVGAPHVGAVVGGTVGAVAPIVRGAIRGGKAALAERLQAVVAKARETALAADAETIPPDVMAELTRESGTPQTAVPQAAPAAVAPQPVTQGGPLRPPVNPAPPDVPQYPVTDVGKLIEIARQNAGLNRGPVRPPVATVQPTALQEFEALKAKLPQQPIPIDLARQLFDEMRQSGTSPSEASPEAAAVEAPKDFAAGARTAKAGKLAQALNDGGISLDDAKLMDPSHWEMLAKGIGVNVPSAASITETLAQLQKLQKPTAMQEFQAIKARMPKGKSAK